MNFKKYSLVLMLLTVTIAGYTQPIIEIDKKIHDFQSLNEGIKYNAEFKITNIGNEPLIISNVASGCGCITTSLPKESIKPNDSKIIQVIYNTAGRMGTFTKSVTLTSNSSKDASILLTIKGVVDNNAKIISTSNNIVTLKEPMKVVTDNQYTTIKVGTFQENLESLNKLLENEDVQYGLKKVGDRLKWLTIEVLKASRESNGTIENTSNSNENLEIKKANDFVNKRLKDLKFEKEFPTILNIECPCQKYSYPGFWASDVYYYKTKSNKWYQFGSTFQIFRGGPFNSLEEAILETEYKTK